MASVASALQIRCRAGTTTGTGKRCSRNVCVCGRRQSLALLALGFGREPVSYASSLTEYEKFVEKMHPRKPDWYEDFFAETMNSTMKSYEAEVAAYKEQLFQQVNQNVKVVVELGIGTGPNLRYYAGRRDLDVIGIDPNEKMETYARNAARSAGCLPSHFKFIRGVGEKLPLPTSSIDLLISTLVLCSVKDLSSTLGEIRRVLRPGGTFMFIEHVAATEGSALRLCQNLLDPVQQLVADGCHLTRDTLSSLKDAKFASIEAQSINVKNAVLISPHIIGTART